MNQIAAAIIWLGSAIMATGAALSPTDAGIILGILAVGSGIFGAVMLVEGGKWLQRQTVPKAGPSSKVEP